VTAIEAVPVTVPPSAHRLRAELRRLRSPRRESRIGDVYLVLMFLVVYGAAIGYAVRRYLPHAGGAGTGPAARWWLVLALVVATAGLAWRGLRAIGPLLAMPDTQTWCLSSPVDRRGWLLVPLAWLILLAAPVGAGLGAVAALLARTSLGWPAAAGAGLGLSLAGLAAALQTRPRHPAEAAPAVAGLLGAAALLGLHAAGVAATRPALPGKWLAGLTALVGVAALAGAVRGLSVLDRASLSAGARVAGAAASAAIFLDPALLTGVLEARRWRRVGRIAGRPLRPGRRWWVLLQADLRRTARRPAALAIFAGLVLVPYALVLLAPAAVGPGRLVAGYLAGARLAAGLRTVAGSPALRRALGGRDRDLRLVHLAVPTGGLVLWWLATLGVGDRYPVLQVVLVAGLVGAVYRNATAPPRSYAGTVTFTPFGGLQGGLIAQLVRGLDVVAVLVLLQLLLLGR
jgi:hypothetical protein